MFLSTARRSRRDSLRWLFGFSACHLGCVGAGKGNESAKTGCAEHLRIVIRADGFNVVVNEKGLSGAMMRFDDGLFERADELADTTDAGPLGQWLIGVVLAALVGVYAVDCLVTGRAAVPSHRWPNPFTEAEGLAATALGLALSLHCALHALTFLLDGKSTLLWLRATRQIDRDDGHDWRRRPVLLRGVSVVIKRVIKGMRSWREFELETRVRREQRQIQNGYKVLLIKDLEIYSAGREGGLSVRASSSASVH